MIFPDPVIADDHDPLGVEVATRIAHDVAGILPPPRGTTPRRRKKWRSEFDEERSGPGPDDRDPQPLGNVLGSYVVRRGWQTQIGMRRLLDRWPQIVGPVNAEHCQPAGFTDKVLLVRAESTTWATVLRQLSPQLVAKLNAELGDGSVQRIEVRGPAAPSWKHGIRSVRDGRGPRDTYG
ncbi:MAG: DciA family protein [Brooklawnia sp.]